MNSWGVYLRYLGFRRLFATAAYWPLVVVLRMILAGVPPSAYYAWAASAQESLGCLVGGTYALAFALWCWKLTQVVVWIKRPALRHAAWSVRAAICSWVSLAALGELTKGLVLMVGHGPDVLVSLALLFGRVAVLPLVCGAAPHLAIDCVERFQMIRILHRWRTAGTGAHASWIAPYALKRFTKPLPGRWQWW